MRICAARLAVGASRIMDMCSHLQVTGAPESAGPWWAWQTLPWAALAMVVFGVLRYTHT